MVAILAISAARSLIDAKHALDQARAAIDRVTASPQTLETPAARASTMQLIDRVESDVQRANDDLRTSPGVSAMWALPYLHSQRQAALNLLSGVETTASTGKTLLVTVDKLAAASHGTSIALPELRQLHAQLASAQVRLTPLSHQSSGVFPLLPPLDHALHTFDRQEAHISSLLADGNQLSSYALTFLGGNGPRTYFLAAQNNAEMRDQGAVLSYALVSTSNGTFDVGSASSVGDIPLSSPAPVPMSSGMQAVFGSWNPTQTWQSTNAAADFPWSGQDMQAMYQQVTGQHVDGVLAMDVPGLARLLQLVGPVSVPGISMPVTASNISLILLHDLYVGVPVGSSQTPRRDLLSSVAKAVFDQMKQEHVDVAAFANALAKDVAGRHLMAWDSVPANEGTIKKFGGSGAVDTQNPSRTFHVAVEDGSANKLDYYVTVSVSEEVVLTQSGDADVQTTITTRNNTPTGVPASYQYGPDQINASVPGEYVARIYMWGPRGATSFGSVPESGLRVSQTTQHVLPQQTGEVQFETVIHRAVQNGQLHLVFVPQPRLAPEHLNIKVEGNGWTVGGPPEVSTTWNKTLSYTWNVAQ